MDRLPMFSQNFQVSEYGLVMSCVEIRDVYPPLSSLGGLVRQRWQICIL